MAVAVVERALCLLVVVAAARAQLILERYDPITESDSAEHFKVFWNVPSFQCHKYGLNFSAVSEEWGLTQNSQDSFRGDQVVLLYDPGLFPALLPTTAGGDPQVRNGGVPQAGDLDRHLRVFAEEVDKLIPDRQFQGIGIIDFEHWRPIWRQNWMSMTVYRDYSRRLERRRHPRMPKQEIEKRASDRFETAARSFMLETLRVAKEMRPLALWGYYGFPFCFNNKPTEPFGAMPCSPEVFSENDRLDWLFSESTALFPSVYLRSELTEHNNKDYVTSRVNEALRMSRSSTGRTPVFVYMWSKYQDANRFISKEDLSSSLVVPRRLGADGVVVWGATKDVNSRERCLATLDYLQAWLGPAAKATIHSAPTTPSSQPNFFSLFGK